MPVVFRHRGFRFGFYSNEGNPREPPHVHVKLGEADAKFWLLPEIELAYNRGHSARLVRELTDIVARRRQTLLEAWDEHFSEG
ncbi:DUF4160 domain-containing protein [uncultured Enterovirga sp.]|uniref:DUF4160 domain-containing protein n=1 Tax=uncultured Enterovirga sp. TaxID=2026352 RepID=UPI0035CA817B